MMDTETNTTFVQDQQAVQAVRGGDAERYRELVERHERRVFAVAWSRLGDATLAEEVAQESFIRAYRRLWLLGDGAKFSAWIAAITRRLAINCGLRHRRELNKRRRWALEQTATPADESAELCPPETLRQALADLPAKHRECLVLFYLEGKSGVEAAAALGISETALRVRLHRARAALREQLDSWFVPLLSLIGTLPSLAFVSIVGRMERKNFRDADGFRPELHRRFFRSFLWGFPLVLLAVTVVNRSVLAAWGFNMQQFFLACFLVVITVISARSLTISRNHFHIGMFAYCVIIAAGVCALALGWLPLSLSGLPILAGTALFFFTFNGRPTRLDYSLFLRASHGLLKASGETNGLPQTNRLNRRALLAFARFLGTRFLVSNFRWETSGLALRLPPVASRFTTGLAGVFLPPMSQNCSHISLGWDGMVAAHCGKTDAGDLLALETAQTTDPRKLDCLVAEVVSQAWREFRAGNLQAAERTLGNSPESDVFIVPPARAKSTRFWKIWMLLMLASMTLQLIHRSNSQSSEMCKPLSITAEEVRTSLAALAQPGIPGSNELFQISTGLYNGYVLPRKTEVFTPEAWRVIHDYLREMIPATVVKPSEKVDRLMCNPVLQEAIINGWLTADDFGLATEDIRRVLSPATAWQNEFWFEPGVLRSSGGYTVLDSSGFSRRMQCLQRLGCLDVVDGRKAVDILLQHQMLSTNTPLGRRRVLFPEQWHGLFLTYGDSPIIETYDALKTLELFGSLGRVDREACVQGILRFHHGKGLFRPLKDHLETFLLGDARETFCAFESLRILGALDRVKDLKKWQFRPQRASQAEATGEPRSVTWYEIEAWVCQQRLARALAEHQQNPAAPWRSLLDP
jgi:RNA polymerase sigma-70 factor (ECF subfamily)